MNWVALFFALAVPFVLIGVFILIVRYIDPITDRLGVLADRVLGWWFK